MAQVSNIHTAEPLLKWRLVLTHADILLLQSAPVTFVPAPLNASNYSRVVAMNIEAHVADGAYTGNAAACYLSLTYGNSSGPIAANCTNAGFGIPLAANVNFIAAGAVSTTLTTNTALVAAQPLVLALINGGGNLTGGNANNEVIVELLVDNFDASYATV
jgi:hypothetical protein